MRIILIIQIYANLCKFCKQIDKTGVCARNSLPLASLAKNPILTRPISPMPKMTRCDVHKHLRWLPIKCRHRRRQPARSFKPVRPASCRRRLRIFPPKSPTRSSTEPERRFGSAPKTASMSSQARKTCERLKIGAESHSPPPAWPSSTSTTKYSPRWRMAIF